MTRKRLVTAIAPAHWASYLINGDRSIWDFHPDPDDEAECLAMEKELGSPVDCVEIGFCWNPDYGKAGECCEYRFLTTYSRIDGKDADKHGENDGMYWVRFRGTRNGEWIRAASMQSAKWLFALKHGLKSITYIQAHKKKPA